MSSSTPPNPTFLQSLQKLINAKAQQPPPPPVADAKSPHRNNSSPAKLKRLFKFNNSSKKTCIEQQQHQQEQQQLPSTKPTELEVVVVDVDNEPVESNLGFIAELGLLYSAPQLYTVKSRLLRSLNFVNAPSLFVLDCAELVVLSQAYRALMDDPIGADFPWPNAPLQQLLSGKKLLRNNPTNGEQCKIDWDALAKGVKGLFFGAKWCPPSKQMLAQLVELYTKIKSDHPHFEIIFCSSDRSEESFNEHFSLMPWLALPYGDEKFNQKIAKAYDICGIPSFILVDDDFSLITRNGRSVCLSDPHGYPWKRKALYELTEHTVHRISEMPSLILFTEGSPEDIEFSCQILNPCAESVFAQHMMDDVPLQTAGPLPSHSEDANSVDSDKSTRPLAVAADPMQFFYTGDDPICDYILESLGQGQADLPLLIICDPLAGHFTVCDRPEVSDSIVLAFVSDYRNGRARVLPIPDSKRQTKHRTVGGIPVQLLEPFLSSSHCLQQQQVEFTKITKFIRNNRVILHDENLPPDAVEEEEVGAASHSEQERHQSAEREGQRTSRVSRALDTAVWWGDEWRRKAATNFGQSDAETVRVRLALERIKDGMEEADEKRRHGKAGQRRSGEEGGGGWRTASTMDETRTEEQWRELREWSARRVSDDSGAGGRRHKGRMGADEWPEEGGRHFEGDIVLSGDQADAILEEAFARRRRQKRKFIGSKVRRWDVMKSIVYTLREQRVIELALEHWHNITCLNFERHNDEPKGSRIVFTDVDGCASNVGRHPLGEPQFVSLAPECIRDQYVQVQWENIDRDSKGQFLKEQPVDVDNGGVPYDYGSIMHYRSKAFAKYDDLFTIGTAIGDYQRTIGQRDQLSFNDIRGVPASVAVPTRRLHRPAPLRSVPLSGWVHWGIL
uniref:Metalloendopeptidase n=1 Tax=Globodera pallida TaxID=36090 RepID=A0A183C376_GLOPA